MLKIIERNISEIYPYENNPRNNDSAVEYVANSIKEFGFKVPIVIDKNGVIVAGHTRYKACKKLGIIEVPCIIADDLTEEQIKAYRLADNKVSELASWDNELLKVELDELYGIFVMEDFGFPVQIENIDLALTEDIEAEEPFAKELDEANNYIVLEFNTETDWDTAQRVFGLTRVQTNEKNPNIRRHGIGRVIDGKKIMDWIKDED